MAASAWTLSTIPSEIVYHICQFLDHASLKQCRFVNHSLEPPASAALFSTVHITTTIQSLRHARSIARSSNLSSKVRTFAYHASAILPSPYTNRHNKPHNFLEFAEFLSRYRSPESTPESCLIPQACNTLELWKDYNAICAARLHLESRGHISQRLRVLLAQFPRITSIQLIPVPPNAAYVPGERVPYLGQADEDAFVHLLGACYDRRGIQCLKANGLHWTSFGRDYDLSVLCINLRKLELALDDDFVGYPESFMRTEFDTFLDGCPNLESLALDMGTSTTVGAYGAGQLQAACDAFLGRVWNKLEQVELTNFITDKPALRGFLLHHRMSLQTVKLESLNIMTYASVFRSAYSDLFTEDCMAALSAKQGLTVNMIGTFWDIKTDNRIASFAGSRRV